MAAQSSDGRLRRRRRSLRYRPCLVRMAVGALRSPWLTAAGFFLVFAAGAEALMAWLSFQHSLVRLTQPVERNEKPIAARCVF